MKHFDIKSVLMKNELARTKSRKLDNNMAAGSAPETCFATPGSVFAMVDNILWAIANSKHNKTYVVKFVPIVKKITKVLNGADANFIRHAEFYSDLKETLKKIEHHILECSMRGKWAKKMMAKKDQKVLEEVGEHVELLITRIVFSFAQRVELMKIARQKKKKLNFSAIEEEEEEVELNQSETSSIGGESTSFGSEEESIGER